MKNYTDALLEEYNINGEFTKSNASLHDGWIWEDDDMNKISGELDTLKIDLENEIKKLEDLYSKLEDENKAAEEADDSDAGDEYSSKLNELDDLIRYYNKMLDTVAHLE